MSLLEARRIDITHDTWATAVAIALMRVGANDAIRVQRRDRGASKNFLNDLQGAVGEIISILHIEKQCPDASVRHDLTNFDGPVDDVDLIVDEAGGAQHRIESKCLLCEPSKKFFLINQTAHQRSEERHATSYLPVLARLGWGTAVVAPLLSINEVNRWEIREFGYGDPARAMLLPAFSQNYIKKDFDKVLKYLYERNSPNSGDLSPEYIMGELRNTIASKIDSISAALNEVKDEKIHLVVNAVGQVVAA